MKEEPAVQSEMQDTTPPAPAKKSPLAILKNPAVIVGLVAVLAVGGMAVWKSMALSSLEEELTAEKNQAVQQAQAETTKAKEEAKAALLAARKESLLLFARPLAWALRDLVTADNQKQIDDYIADLIKQPGFDRIVLARVDGSIALASDRKMIDAKLDTVYPAAVQEAQAPMVLDSEGGKTILVVPIMGMTEKMAVLALTYDPTAPATPHAATPAPTAPGAAPPAPATPGETAPAKP